METCETLADFNERRRFEAEHLIANIKTERRIVQAMSNRRLAKSLDLLARRHPRISGWPSYVVEETIQRLMRSES